MYGRGLSLAGYRGRIVILSFIDARAADEALAWLRDTPTDLMGDRTIAFVNVLYPGPSPAFSSRSAKLRKLRATIEENHRNVWRRMPPGDQRRLEATEMRWVIDFHKDIFGAYAIESGGVHIFVIDAQGRVREVLRHRTPRTVRRLDAVLGHLRAKHNGRP